MAKERKPQKKPIRPMLAVCWTCGADPGIKCMEQGFELEIPHLARWQTAEQQQRRAPERQHTKPLSLRCPHCGAMPNRQCQGPPPYRNPVSLHKARYLAAEKIDNTINKARGRVPGVSAAELPPEERPWLKNKERPVLKPLTWREKQALGEGKRARDAEKERNAEKEDRRDD